MVARIEGFRTRSQVGLRRPDSISYNVTPQHGGLAVHWNGPRAANSTHAQCEATWRNVQKFHMETNGWVDVAYSVAFCNHGYVLAGRGYGVRTAANGTNFGNQNYLAAYWIGGSGQEPTQKAYDALDWIIVDFRKKGAGRRVRPHQDFTGSACPGSLLIRQCRNRDNRNIASTAPAAPEEDELAEITTKNQKLLNSIADELGKDSNFRPTTLPHIINAYRALAKEAGVSGANPEDVMSRVVVADSPEQAQLLRGTVSRLAEADARPTSLAHVLNTHRAIARVKGVAGNDPDAIAESLR